MEREEHAIVLDFLAHGHALEGRGSPVAQVLGLNHFTLLEVAPKKEVFLRPHDKVYLGHEKRDKIHHIIGKVDLARLTNTAQEELRFVIRKLVEEDEKKFVKFYNYAQAVSTRQHSLELLPGIGKKHMWKIVEEREYEPFKSFEDIKERVELMPDPKEAIVKRIILELENKDKYKFFTGQNI